MPKAKRTAKPAQKRGKTGSGNVGTAEGKGKRKMSELKKVVPAKKAKKGSDSAPPTSKQKDEVQMKKLTFSGKVPVDENCKQCANGYHVFSDNHYTLGVTLGTVHIYNAMLNQTNVGKNNNKYYILQLLKHDQKEEYATWFRWGRVGKVAGTSFKSHGSDVNAAKKMFTKKFHEKTNNNWWWRDTFRKWEGKYDMLEIDYGQQEETPKLPDSKTKKQKPGRKEVPSKLDKRVQEVIDMIFDVREFEACVKELEFDVKKAPLGKLTTKQIKAGYESLKVIENCINKKKFGKELTDACNTFYTKIPHDFGMKVPPLIKTPEQLKQKLELLEALGEIQIAFEMINKKDKKDDVNVKDQLFESLGCKMDPLDKSNPEYKMVHQYVKNSHGSTHSRFGLNVEDVYRVERAEDVASFKKNIGNRMLLWHGSRMANWCGILKQGLRIAPPEAPVTGYMFGKGVYFADIVSKSANYCHANKRQPRGFLLLCEVSLGKTNDKRSSDYNASKLPKGKSSTKGIGGEAPDSKGHKTLDCGTVVPLGKPKKSSISPSPSLIYNEYIVYDVSQIKARYLVKVKFDGKHLW